MNDRQGEIQRISYGLDVDFIVRGWTTPANIMLTAVMKNTIY